MTLLSSSEFYWKTKVVEKSCSHLHVSFPPYLIFLAGNGRFNQALIISILSNCQHQKKRRVPSGNGSRKVLQAILIHRWRVWQSPDLRRLSRTSDQGSLRRSLLQRFGSNELDYLLLSWLRLYSFLYCFDFQRYWGAQWCAIL